MLRNTKKTKSELKKYYETLEDEYEGYVQMSDSRFKDEHLFYHKKSLPPWGVLHPTDINYILEMALFDGSKSILIRQHNANFLVWEKDLDGKEDMDAYFIVTDKEHKKKMKIAQIWEEASSEFCEVDGEALKALEPKYLMFAGFEDDKGKES
jgi:CRISPR type III-associated protein (TIGR04423 family)